MAKRRTEGSIIIVVFGGVRVHVMEYGVLVAKVCSVSLPPEYNVDLITPGIVPCAVAVQHSASMDTSAIGSVVKQLVLS